MELDDKFLEKYKPLLVEFFKEIENVNAENLPIPFIPYFGSGYETTLFKIAFVGWETRDSINLSNFISEFNKDPEDTCYWFRETLENNNFEFLDGGYMNNTGRDFWGFILQFLSIFYGIEDWKELKRKKFPAILKSFVWGNLDSIERFEAKKNRSATREDYDKVKQASKTLDRFDILLDVFRPNIVVILCKKIDEKKLFSNISKYLGPEEIEENLLKYYYVEDTNTHIYCTHHPISLSFKGINFNDFIFRIIRDMNNKNIINEFPGIEMLNKYNKRPVLFNKLKRELCEGALKLNLSAKDDNWGIGKESYLSFYLPDSKYETLICFGFENLHKEFSVGVYLEKQNFPSYMSLKTQIGDKLSCVIGEDSNLTNWAYLHYYKNNLKDWDKNEKIWNEIENGIIFNNLIKIVETIKMELSTIEL